jgi:hypothetical protein
MGPKSAVDCWEKPARIPTTSARSFRSGACVSTEKRRQSARDGPRALQNTRSEKEKGQLDAGARRMYTVLPTEDYAWKAHVGQAKSSERIIPR